MDIEPMVKCIWKSWTVWFSMVLIVLPDIVDLLLANFPVVGYFIPDEIHPRILSILGLISLLLRIRTSTALALKGQRDLP